MRGIRNGLAVLSLAVALAPLAARAEDAEEIPPEVEGAKDHPGFKRFPGTVMVKHTEKDFETFKFPAAGGKLITAEGRFFHGGYYVPRKSSCTEWLRNHENAFKAAGLKVSKGAEVPEGFEMDGNSGHWVSADGTATGGLGTVSALAMCEPDLREANLVVVEKKAMEQKVEVTADGLADEIAKTGHVAVYGIHFATGKADVTPDSAKVLDEIGKLLKDKADWKLRIEGHTDNVGKAAANLALSKKRAAEVKDWLVKKYGIDAKRLSSDGYGDTKPVAPNTDESGRAKNRRVELAKP